MTKSVLIATNLGLAVLLAATLSIAAGEKTATVNSAGENRAEAVPAKTAETPPMKAPAAELLDINIATAVQLQKVLGVGVESAKKIIAGRPYVKKDQLKSRKILTAAHYYKIKDRIIARRPAVAAKTDRS